MLLCSFVSCTTLPHLAIHRAVDVTGDLFCGGEHEAVHSHDVAARHADARVAEKRFDGQFAQAQS